jgi:Ala-tRNA(Pro) deacylase
MSNPDALKAYLEQKKVRYEVLKHPEAFTAQEVAHAIHKTGKVLAKTVVVDADGNHVMVVVPAHQKVKLDALRKLLDKKDVRLSPEENLRGLFPDCDLGAMPPIGSLYNMKVVVSKELSEKPDIIFNACTHTDCVKMAFSDFQNLVGATLAEVSA